MSSQITLPGLAAWMASAGDRVVIPIYSDTASQCQCYTYSDGAPVLDWSFQIPSGTTAQMWYPVFVNGNTLYFVTGPSYLPGGTFTAYGLDLESGESVFEYQVSSTSVVYALALAGDVLLLTNWDWSANTTCTLTAVSLSGGEELWTLNGKAIESAVIAGENVFYFDGTVGGIYAVGLQTGTPVAGWSTNPWTPSNAAASSLAYDSVTENLLVGTYASNGATGQFALSASDGTVQWQVSTFYAPVGSQAYAYNGNYYYYYGTTAGLLYSGSMSDGTQGPSYALGVSPSYSPIVINLGQHLMIGGVGSSADGVVVFDMLNNVFWPVNGPSTAKWWLPAIYVPTVGPAGTTFISSGLLGGTTPLLEAIPVTDIGPVSAGPLVGLISTDSTLFGTDAAGNIYQYQNVPTLWEQIGGPAAQVVAGGLNLYYLDSSGNVYQYQGTPNLWTQIGTGFSSLAAGGNTLLGMSSASAGTVSFYTGTPQQWSSIIGSASAVAASTLGKLAISADGTQLMLALPLVFFGPPYIFKPLVTAPSGVTYASLYGHLLNLVVTDSDGNNYSFIGNGLTQIGSGWGQFATSLLNVFAISEDQTSVGEYAGSEQWQTITQSATGIATLPGSLFLATGDGVLQLDPDVTFNPPQ